MPLKRQRMLGLCEVRGCKLPVFTLSNGYPGQIDPPRPRGMGLCLRHFIIRTIKPRPGRLGKRPFAKRERLVKWLTERYRGVLSGELERLDEDEAKLAVFEIRAKLGIEDWEYKASMMHIVRMLQHLERKAEDP